MTPTDLETVYDTLAKALDSVGPDRSTLFLAKLALALSEEVGSAAPCVALIEECKTGLLPAP
ncbi:hypothetical protein [Nioella nitratireducens]|uniref:hypothetical protein n=1 Tax=Nioella nitratireducens TaxID=1287720 RepID=UPI0008FD16ED|nr:hypothetical protein [Nioella nitratireducens]